MSQNDMNVEEARRLIKCQLADINGLVHRVAIANRLSETTEESFTCYVYGKLFENDCARIRKFQNGSSLRTFLTVVLARLFRDFARRELGSWRRSTVTQRLDERAVRPDEHLGQAGLSLVNDAIESLASEDALVLKMWLHEGRPACQIARAVGLSPQEVVSILSSQIQWIRQELREKGIERHQEKAFLAFGHTGLNRLFSEGGSSY